MAKIQSGNYSGLAGYSDSSGVKRGGPFVSVFIPVEPRAGQRPGTLNARDFENDLDIFKNKDEIRFIALFIKKLRVATEKVEGKENDAEKITYFSWNPDKDTDFPANAKVRYVIAGVLVDETGKVMKDPREKEQHAQFIYFKCAGVKMSSAIAYLNLLGEKFKQLDKLSEDDNFEKAVVTPRRFITKVTVGTQKTDYGNKYIFILEPEKLLPDDVVVGANGKPGIMDQSVQWIEPFKKQFDFSDLVVEKSDGEAKPAFSMDKSKKTPKFDDTSDENAVTSGEAQLDIDMN